MTQAKNLFNGMAGGAAAIATIGSQMQGHVDPWIKLLAGIGGLIVIALTIYVSLLTARKTKAETRMVDAQRAMFERQYPSKP